MIYAAPAAPQPEPEVAAAEAQTAEQSIKALLYVFRDVRLTLLSDDYGGKRLMDTYRLVMVESQGRVRASDYSYADEETALEVAPRALLHYVPGAVRERKSGKPPKINEEVVQVVRDFPPREFLLEADSQFHVLHARPRTMEDTLEELDQRLTSAAAGLDQMRRHFCAYADAEAAAKLFRRARRGRRALADLAGLLHSRFGGPFR
jgi:hypothetical protein